MYGAPPAPSVRLCPAMPSIGQPRRSKTHRYITASAVNTSGSLQTTLSKLPRSGGLFSIVHYLPGQSRYRPNVSRSLCGEISYKPTSGLSRASTSDPAQIPLVPKCAGIWFEASSWRIHKVLFCSFPQDWTIDLLSIKSPLTNASRCRMTAISES